MSDQDPYNLNRFVVAQAGEYEQAFREIQAGRKESHWMWYIFPQFVGLGRSVLSQHFAIRSLAEARAYLAHPLLGPRLEACCHALLTHSARTAHQILGSPDDVKLRSSATLFALASAEGSVFVRVLEAFFEGEMDRLTVKLVSSAGGVRP